MNERARYVIDRIRGARTAAVLCHTRADGDALGSAFALARICRSLGVRAGVLTPDPAPERLGFLCDSALWWDAGEQPELTISVDVASPEQLGSLKDDWCERVDLKIDHHLVSLPFGGWSWVEPDAAAAGELVAQIADELGGCDAQTATLIYAAICSDTGGFRYSNTTARTFAMAQMLCEWGADTADVAERLFENKSLRECRAEGYVYGNLRLSHDGRCAVVLITEASRTQTETLDEDYGNASALLRGIDGVQLAIAIKQDSADHDKYKLSMRSRDPIDCAALCAALGGGGHARAAGASLRAADPEEAALQIARLCAQVFA